MPSHTTYFQETFLGLLLHAASGGTLLRYREEQPGFVAPARYHKGYKTALALEQGEAKQDAAQHHHQHQQHQQHQQQQQHRQAHEPRRTDSDASSTDTAVGGGGGATPPTGKTSEKGVSGSGSGSSGDGMTPAAPTQSPTFGDLLERPPASLDTCAGDPYLVEYDEGGDADDPQQWPLRKKLGTLGLLCLLTTSVYMGSAIYTPAVPLIAEYFGVGITTATLGLTLFVFGYGIGPMIGLSAMSEIPAIGRTFPYIITLFLFVVLQVPQALVNNVAGFMILRFLSGLVGSPPLATGGASIQEIFSPRKSALGLGAWGLSAVMGPALGPLIGGYASAALGWRWTIWPLLFLSGFTLAVLVFLLPETSSNNILLRRAQRLRKATGNPHLRSKGELIAKSLTGHEIALMTFVRPFRLGLGEPIALGINLHIALVYSVLYIFFEAFPIVFTQTYGFGTGETGLAFMGILVAAVIGWLLFYAWHTTRYEPAFDRANGKLEPEIWLEPALFGAFCIPIALFGFGWTSNASIHWIVPIVLSGFFSIGTFAIFQSGLAYLAQGYGNYVASILSGNDFFRSYVAGALPLVARPLFDNLQANGPRAFPVAWGSTLLGCISLAMVPIPYLLYKFGPTLRRWSKYATSPGEEAKVMT